MKEMSNVWIGLMTKVMKIILFLCYLPNIARIEQLIKFSIECKHDHGSSAIDWPCNEVFPVNEFHTPGYITRAFPTLYPCGHCGSQ